MHIKKPHFPFVYRKLLPPYLIFQNRGDHCPNFVSELSITYLIKI